MAQVVDDPIAAGREAVRRRDWLEAYDLLSSVQAELGGADLEQLGEAAFWTQRLDEAVALRERAHKAYLDEGDRLRAAGIAVRLSLDYMLKAALPLSNGWFAKGERLLADLPQAREHGQVALVRAIRSEFEGNFDNQIEYADRAFEIGERFGDAE